MIAGGMSAVVDCESGKLAGGLSADGKIHVFRAIPYARPPVGPLRWRPPQPAERWEGIRSAVRFGPRCIQPDRPQNSVSYFGPEHESEDCLYLNVWTPALERGARRPVMVWFHGGGFSVGSGSLPIFDGEALARRGVVLVTLNYRIGGLGFLAHPELTRESPQLISGNWGLLDQIAALHWVQQNIDNFGGDPQNVTIFGQSVGSTCVNSLMASPLTQGLFHRAIGESGGSMVPLGRPGGGSMLRLAEAEKIGLRVADSFGCRSLDDLRAKPARDVQLLWPKQAACRPFIVVDGSIVPDSVYDTFDAGRQHNIPLLTGANSDEASARGPAASLQEWISSLQSEFGDEWKRLFDAYGGGENFAYMSRRLACQKGFNWVNWTWARLHAKLARRKVFFYHFSHAPPLPSGETFAEGDRSRLGAFHTAEIPYVFGTLGKRDWPWTDADFELSDAMSSYWVNFATCGDPNGPDLPDWPAFDPTTPSVMLFNGSTAPGALPGRDLFDLWDDCMKKLRG